MIKTISSGHFPMIVERIDMSTANTTEDNRINFTTELAAISRGASKAINPEKRYKSFFTEAERNTPSRPLEFLPIILKKKNLKHTKTPDLLMKFSHEGSGHKIYTTMRACINAKIDYDLIPYGKTNDFIAFKIMAPMFVWAQIATHTQLSMESQSDRLTSEDKYWLPIDIEERTGYKGKDFAYKMLKEWSQDEVQEILKDAGYKREIYSRAPYYFKMKTFVLTGWINNDLSWYHFLRERNAYKNKGIKNWTQKETEQVAVAIKELIELTHKETF